MKILPVLLSVTLLLGGGVLAVQAGQETKKQDPVAAEAKAVVPDAAIIAAQLPSYPLETCVVSGEPMDEPVSFVAEGQLLQTCCKMCAKKVKAEPASYVEKVRAAVIAAQKPSYPLSTCAISGEKLGSMGEPLALVHGTRLVQLCCKGCVKGFKKDPAATLAKIDAALIEQQKKTYALETCVVSGEKLGSMGEPIDKLYGVTLVRLCCKGCIKKYEADPAKYVALVTK